jgi:hypothetical protein
MLFDSKHKCKGFPTTMTNIPKRATVMINETFGLVQDKSIGMEGSPSTSFLQKNSSPMVAPFSLSSG